MSGYTKGPWFTKREGFSTVYVEARISGGFIQEVAACGPTAAGNKQQDANAKLIAAAPDLLEALQAAKFYIIGEALPTKEHALSMIDAAIKKATE